MPLGARSCVQSGIAVLVNSAFRPLLSEKM